MVNIGNLTRMGVNKYSYLIGTDNDRRDTNGNPAEMSSSWSFNSCINTLKIPHKLVNVSDSKYALL